MEKIKEKKAEKLCLVPADEHVSMQFRALDAINGFRKLGFSSFSAFYSIFTEYYENDDTVDMYKKLQAFWNLRNFHEEWIERAERIVEKLKLQ